MDEFLQILNYLEKGIKPFLIGFIGHKVAYPPDGARFKIPSNCRGMVRNYEIGYNGGERQEEES